MNARKAIPQPPQPVEISNPEWVSRAWQWIFDRLIHLDECIDEMKDNNNEFKKEAFDLIKAVKKQGGQLSSAFEEHQRVHTEMHKLSQARESVWKKQFSWLRDLIKIASSGAVMGVAIFILKQLGVL